MFNKRERRIIMNAMERCDAQWLLPEGILESVNSLVGVLGKPDGDKSLIELPPFLAAFGFGQGILLTHICDKT
jgi:hypothetical protein